jgi:cyclohexadieny/prephenate dehydrogenase
MRCARPALAAHIAGFDASADVRARAAKIGLSPTRSRTASEAAVQNADLVILADARSAPTNRSGQAIAGHLKPGAILTDVGSVKGAVVRDVGPLRSGRGAFHSRPSHRRHRIFRSRSGLCQPVRRALDHPDAAARRRARGHRDALKSFWEGCGAQVEVMDVAHHDLVLAMTSHVPHLIAYNIVGTAHDLEDGHRRRSDQISPPAAFAISPASRLPIR